MKKLLWALGALTLLGIVALVTPPATAGDVATYTVQLTGANEVPGPGDPDGMATATVQFGTVSNEVCVTALTISGLATPTLFHIHQAPVGVAGPIVVDLMPALASVPYCTTIDPALMAELITGPDGFYLNIHNADFPAGAIRGQFPGATPPPSSASTSSTTATTSAPAAATQPSFTG